LKKKIIAFAALVLCMTVFASSTLAYFTKDNVATNVFTTSGIDIELHEWADTDKTIPYDRQYPNNTVQMMPGSKLTKVVTVENVDEPAYIRAAYRITVTKINDDGSETLLLDSFRSNDKGELNRIISITGTHDNWDLSGEIYYYKTAVNSGAVTEPLFTHVEFSGPNMDNRYQNCRVEIEVAAQGLQSANIAVNGNVSDMPEWNKAFNSNVII